MGNFPRGYSKRAYTFEPDIKKRRAQGARDPRYTLQELARKVGLKTASLRAYMQHYPDNRPVPVESGNYRVPRYNLSDFDKWYSPISDHIKDR